MTQAEKGELQAEVVRLRQMHRDLDSAIAALEDSPGGNDPQDDR
jgi:hypothetical protein